MNDVPSKKRLLKTAQLAGNILIKEAEYVNDGSISWGRGADLNLNPVPDGGIFNGRCGEAFFFGALYKATNEIKFKKASIMALAGLKKSLSDATYQENLIQQLGLGLLGVGGIIYALVRVSEFINDESIAKDAVSIAESITPEHVKKDFFLEIVRGSAGLIPGLLALSDKGFKQALHLAGVCGDHLLENRVLDSLTGLNAWAVQRDTPVSGFAHGSSGIAHSILKLYKRTGELRFYEAAIQAFSFERSIFSNDEMNWPDSREQKRINMCSWCWGATGIGFSRIEALEVIKKPDEADIAMDLMIALKKTNSLSLHKTDNLCCGNFGRIDFLHEAGERLGNMTLKQAALKKIRTCLDNTTNDVHQFKLPPVNPLKPHLAPGFWKGVAGCGYTLLRLADTKSFPCVLMLE